LATGKDLPDVIKGTAGDVSWGCGDAEVYYSTQAGTHNTHSSNLPPHLKLSFMLVISSPTNQTPCIEVIALT
jgi:hypothetical protein